MSWQIFTILSETKMSILKQRSKIAFLCATLFTFAHSADNKKALPLARSALSQKGSRLAKNIGINSMLLNSDYESPGKFFARCHKEIVLRSDKSKIAKKTDDHFSNQLHMQQENTENARRAFSAHKKYIFATLATLMLCYRIHSIIAFKWASLIKRFGQKRTTKAEKAKK